MNKKKWETPVVTSITKKEIEQHIKVAANSGFFCGWSNTR
jgi:hypothetical protein